MSEDDDVKKRYAARLGGDEEQNDQNDERVRDSMNAESAGNDGSNESVQNVWNVGNVKQEWKGWTVYLPEEYLDDVTDQGKLLDVRLDRDVKLDRHFKPMLIALGMERMEGMDDEELEEFLARMECGEIGAEDD